jgi:hypothetical protein
MSDVPVAPKNRRRWWVGLLILLIAVGGGVWWRTRLTPDEQLLVGHWRAMIQMPGSASDEISMEFRRDRTLFCTGTTAHWAARKGQFYLKEIPTNPELRSYYRGWIRSGFKNWHGPEAQHGRLEIIDHNTVRITIREEGFDDDVAEMKRIVEE